MLQEHDISTRLHLHHDSQRFVNVPGNVPASISTAQQRRGSCTPEVAPEGPQVSQSPSSGLELTESPNEYLPGRPGVLWCESTHKWEARAYANGRLELLGCFDTEEEAAQQ